MLAIKIIQMKVIPKGDRDSCSGLNLDCLTLYLTLGNYVTMKVPKQGGDPGKVVCEEHYFGSSI